MAHRVWLAWIGLVAACGAASPERSVRNGGPPTVTEAQVLAVAEAEVREAATHCPRSALLPGPPCRNTTAVAARRRATEYLQLLATCREAADADCLHVATELPAGSTFEMPGCREERAAEVAAWREAAVVLSQMISVDCRIAGATGSAGRAECGQPAEPMLIDAGLAALEISSGVSHGPAMLDALAATLQHAIEVGSAAMHLDVVDAVVASAVATTLEVDACEEVPRWRSGAGLTTLRVAGAPLQIAAPEGASSDTPGVVELSGARPLRVGLSVLPFDALIASAPPECTPIPGHAGAFDCVGEALYAPVREVWVIVDLSDVRSVGVQRIAQDASERVREGAVILLSGVTRTGALDLGAPGGLGVTWPSTLPVASFAETGTLMLSERLAPGAGVVTVTAHLEPDADACDRARAAGHAISSVERSDAGCDVAELASGTWGTVLHVLRVVRRGDRYLVLERVSPTTDADAARAALPEALGALDAIAPAEGAL